MIEGKIAEFESKSDFEFVTILLYSHVKWISKSKALKRFILRQEMKRFLRG